MNIKDLKDSLKYMFEAQVTPFIWGHAGVGKSSVVKQYAMEKGYHFFPFYLGTMCDNGDILGLATFEKDKNGQDVATKFAMPVWLKEAVEYCNSNPKSGAVIFLDEFNRGNREVLNGMFSFALDKTFHTIKLPKNCYIVAAGNPPTEEYQTTDINDTALLARFVHIKLEPSFDEWVDYSKNNDTDYSLVEFMREQPKLLEEERTVFELPVKRDRRSWERVNKLIKVNTPPNLLSQLMFGIVGVESTVAFEQYHKDSDKPVSGEDILSGLALDKIKKWSDTKGIKSSMLNISCENLLQTVVQKNKKQEALTSNERRNLHTFFHTAPKDISYKAILKLHEKYMPIFLDFVNDPKYNKSLLKLLTECRGK